MIDAVGRTIGVDHRDDRDAELLGLMDGDVLVADIDDEQRIGQRLHGLDASEAALELDHLAAQLRRFLLAALVERAGMAISCNSPRRLIEPQMVLKSVSIPPSQRWLTYGIAARCASFWTASRAERLVPTNSTVPPSATICLINEAAWANGG